MHTCFLWIYSNCDIQGFILFKMFFEEVKSNILRKENWFDEMRQDNKIMPKNFIG